MYPNFRSLPFFLWSGIGLTTDHTYKQIYKRPHNAFVTGISWLFFEAGDLQGQFFEKTENGVFRYALEKCVYRISGLYRFSFGQE